MTIFRYITFTATFDRFENIIIAFFVILNKQIIIHNFLMDYDRKNIGFEFLIFRRMGVIKSPLLQRYIFCNEKS